MTYPDAVKRHLPALLKKMQMAGLPRIAVDAFSRYYVQVASGETGCIWDAQIRPVDPSEIEDAAGLSGFAASGEKVLSRSVRIVLNGGLGTSMGLASTKSLLWVKNRKSFLEIILKQVGHQGVRLALMNSYNTDAETRRALQAAGSRVQPILFLQHKFPKILKATLAPVSYPQNPDLEWNPPGHGNIYAALCSSDVLDQLIHDGMEYALLSNSDNLGAVMDTSLLGYFANKGLPFMMEVAQRTPTDIKGGHLAVFRQGGFVLREAAQCPRAERSAFQDIRHYRYFNTNNIWINLVFLKERLQKEAVLPLPLILNEKNLDPRDENSPKVYQVESAMGAAISLFTGAGVVLVPKTRLIPVKKCSDLLLVRSDRYRLTEDARLIIDPYCRTGDISLFLDPRFYGRIDAFESRFKDGIPSLQECESLEVYGDVRFQKDVKIVGKVRIENRKPAQVCIPSGTLVDEHRIF